MSDKPLLSSVNIPLPMQIVIDDVGWWCGRDGHLQNEPYRTGIQRDHVPADYMAIVELGRRLGMRPIAAMVMGEWDTGNILAQVPSSTWMGRGWDNRRWVGPWLAEAADIIRTNRQHLEPAIHALAHEYWSDGNMSRAEFYTEQNVMRPREEVLAHLQAFEAIWQQHSLGPRPEMYVPPAFRHAFGFGDGLAPILREFGVNWIGVLLGHLPKASEPEHELFGIDHGVLTVDGGRTDLLPWDAIGREPGGQIPSAIIGMHWPNILHPDPQRNLEIVEAWVRLLKPYDDRVDRMLAPDTRKFNTQLIHHVYTKTMTTGDEVRVDLSGWNDLPAQPWAGPMTLKCCSVHSRLQFRASDAQLTSQSMTGVDGHSVYTIELTVPKGQTTASLTCGRGPG